MKRTTALGLALALGLMVAPVAVGAGGTPTPAGTAALAAALPASTVHGVNFQIKSFLNTNFCIQDESGTTEGRALTLQTCGNADVQRWALVDYVTGLNQLLDSQGMCVDVRGLKIFDPLSVHRCHGDRVEKLTYTSTGLLEYAKGCLDVGGDASGAPIFLARCDATRANQQWQVTH